ncbi:hypothetical protein [Flavobacterium succinicans]|uniref:hypothetical protein n=1 Tax=Flavobacterium succinicans TaxID=29536 RepID=UPI0012FBAC8D|nr:hypothetical protein [Flavobacterium succinicans]
MKLADHHFFFLYVLKTERSRLALMGAASLLDGVRQARYSGQQDDSSGEHVDGAPRTNAKKYSFFGDKSYFYG